VQSNDQLSRDRAHWPLLASLPPRTPDNSPPPHPFARRICHMAEIISACALLIVAIIDHRALVSQAWRTSRSPVAWSMPDIANPHRDLSGTGCGHVSVQHQSQRVRGPTPVNRPNRLGCSGDACRLLGHHFLVEVHLPGSSSIPRNSGLGPAQRFRATRSLRLPGDVRGRFWQPMLFRSTFTTPHRRTRLVRFGWPVPGPPSGQIHFVVSLRSNGR